MAHATIYSNIEPVAVYTRYGESVSAALKAAGARWDPREKAWRAPAELVRRLAEAGDIELQDWTTVSTAQLIAHCTASEDREAFWALAKRICDELGNLPYETEISASGKACYVSIETRAFSATMFVRFDGKRLSFEASLVDDVPAAVAERFAAVAEMFNTARE
jgi:hypothetical protein